MSQDNEDNDDDNYHQYYHKEVWIDYTNYRGERAIRHIKVLGYGHGSNDYHTEPQDIVFAIDRKNGAFRTFAVKDIHEWFESDPEKIA